MIQSPALLRSVQHAQWDAMMRSCWANRGDQGLQGTVCVVSPMVRGSIGPWALAYLYGGICLCMAHYGERLISDVNAVVVPNIFEYACNSTIGQDCPVARVDENAGAKSKPKVEGPEVRFVDPRRNWTLARERARGKNPGMKSRQVVRPHRTVPVPTQVAESQSSV